MPFAELLLALTRLLDVQGFCNLIALVALLSFLLLHWPLYGRYRRLIARLAGAEAPGAVTDALVEALAPLAAPAQVQARPLAWLRGDLLVEAAGRRQLASAIPGMITALGILGTFLGLILGLVSFDVSDTITLRDSITNMMLGIRLAFLTSVTAIAASILWNLLDRLLLQHYENGLRLQGIQLRSRISPLAPDPTPDGDHTARALREGLRGIGETIRDALAPELERLESLHRELRDVQSAAVRSLESIPRRAEEAAEILEKAGQSLARSAERTEKAVQETARMSEGLHQAGERLLRASEHVGRIQADIQSWSETVTERMARAADGLNGAGDDVRRMSEETRRQGEEARRQIQEISRGLRDAADRFQQGADRSLQESLDALDAGLAEVSGQLSGSLQEVRDTIGELPGLLHELRDVLGGH